MRLCSEIQGVLSIALPADDAVESPGVATGVAGVPLSMAGVDGPEPQPASAVAVTKNETSLSEVGIGCSSEGTSPRRPEQPTSQLMHQRSLDHLRAQNGPRAYLLARSDPLRMTG